MPAVKPAEVDRSYDIYPAFNIGEGKIFRGISSLVESVTGKDIILIDGFVGVFFNEIKSEIDRILVRDYNIHARWINTESFLKSGEEIDLLVAPFLGGDDPLFGTRTSLKLIDFFSQFPDIKPSPVIIYGPGAAMFSENGYLIYFDLPKNELQFRSRAGSVRNLGMEKSDDPKRMYKRFYFIDWVVFNLHKKEILKRIDILADSQRPDDITWIHGKDFRDSLSLICQSAFRVRPWFEPGSWGGSWIKNRIGGINREVPNYAWSFELITPENGILVTGSGLLIEFSFDFLMYQEALTLLGDSADRFGTDFPIRFDFLDTFDGGNLSIQCHPRKGYMKENFGEDFTQEETYYILDAREDAGVYLGFRDDINPEKFRERLEESHDLGIPVEIPDYVMFHPARKHDLFLIPAGTVHGSGSNNLVLEISSTPYIFTFKMYDWLRPDLDGKPRPLNIASGMENLFFDRKGKKVTDELISHPVLVEEGDDWQLYHLPTHQTQLYDVKRYHLKTSVQSVTENRFYVMSLVEGEKISVETRNGKVSRFSYAETFIIPAGAEWFKISNESSVPAVVVMAYVKQ